MNRNVVFRGFMLVALLLYMFSATSLVKANDHPDVTSNPEMTAKVVWEYRETPDFYTSIGGDADRLPNGNTLITDTTNGRIIEVTGYGEKVWELVFENSSRFMPRDYMLYRSERIPDLDLSTSSLYNSTGYDTPYNITLTVWNSEKASNGITFVHAWGNLWGINMTGHAIWKYPGYWYEQKMLANKHLFLVWPDPSMPGLGRIREIDMDGNVIFNIKLNVHHDAIKLANSINMMYLAKVSKEINGTRYKGDEIRQLNFRKKDVVWRWNTFDYLPMSENCSIEIEKRDWTHSNSIKLNIEKNRKVLYLSVRNLNQIVKIDFQTKEIIWKLGENGDFRMFEKNGTEVTKLFSHQHDPEIQPNGNILLFDNGFHRDEGKPYSRAIEIELSGVTRHNQIGYMKNGEYQSSLSVLTSSISVTYPNKLKKLLVGFL